jgi:TPR repeat protein
MMVQPQIVQTGETTTFAKYCFVVINTLRPTEFGKIMSPNEDSTNNFIAEFLNSAQEEKKGIYSDEPKVTSQKLAQEVKAAEADFSQVIGKELKRIKVFADQENDRILELRRQNEEDVTCPICLDAIPAIFMEDEVREVLHMTCCGAFCHQKCFAEWDRRCKADPTVSRACFHCKRNISDTTDAMKHLEEMSKLHVGSKVSQAHALNEIGLAYEDGTGGKKRNLKKALKYYKEAVEKGNEGAQSKMALICHLGAFHEMPMPKSPEKAMDMAQRAADQGNPKAQTLLGKVLTQYDSGMKATTEAHRLYALSAYQGDITGMMELEQFYFNQFKNIIRKGSTFIQESREYLLLSLYWTGRLCNKKGGDDMILDGLMLFMVNFLSRFQIAMKMFWHMRPCIELEPLTGYSHIPFLTSIRKVCQVFPSNKSTLQVDIWKHICANCGKQGDEECTLKQCAKCKAFSFCSKDCQVKHWKAGHKTECKGHHHWIESYFPNIRTPST